MVALLRLEAIIRGMEYFGAKPGGVKAEWLKFRPFLPDLCVGFFAMRYGGIDPKIVKSITLLE
jgi:hypothetical protein